MRTSSKINRKYSNEDIIVETTQWPLTATGNNMESWVRTTNLVFCSVCNASTFFEKSTKKSLTRIENVPLQTRYLQWSTASLPALYLDDPQREGISYQPLRNVLMRSVGRDLQMFTASSTFILNTYLQRPLTRNKNYGSVWSDMSNHGLLFQ